MSVHPAPPGPVSNGRRRCRKRPIAASSPRPSELLRLFFLTGLLVIAASALELASTHATVTSRTTSGRSTRTRSIAPSSACASAIAAATRANALPC